MHYTCVPNILKVLNPLFLDDLRAAECLKQQSFHPDAAGPARCRRPARKFLHHLSVHRRHLRIVSRSKNVKIQCRCNVRSMTLARKLNNLME
jgi:hypothetical protein